MKTQSFFQSLTQQVNCWRRKYKAVHRFYLSKARSHRLPPQRTACISKVKINKTKYSIRAVGLGSITVKRSTVVLLLAVLSLTGVLGHKYYYQPKLRPGIPAPATITATYSATIEDQKQTEAKRKAASSSTMPVLMVNVAANQEIELKLQHWLENANEIRRLAGPFPFFDTYILTLPTQHYLRSCSDLEWQQILQAVRQKDQLKPDENKNIANAPKQAQTKALVPASQADTTEVNPASSVNFEQAIAQLQTYKVSTSNQNVWSLIEKIYQIRLNYNQVNTKLLQLNTQHNSMYADTVLLEMSDSEWGKTQTGIRESAQRIIAQGIPPGLPINILQDAVSLQVQFAVPEPAQAFASNLLINVLQPNLTKDEQQTQQQAQQAAARVKPVKVSIHKDEVIVRKGDIITSLDFELLDYYGLSRREIYWRGLIKLSFAVGFAVIVFAFVETKFSTSLRQRDRLLIVMLLLSIPLVLRMGTPYTTWSAVGILLGSFYGSTLGLTAIALLGLLLPISFDLSRIALLTGIAGGMLGCWMTPKSRSREELALLGFAIALTEAGVYLILKLLFGGGIFLSDYTVFQEAGLFGLSGLVWSIVALGLSPYLERLFDVVTPIRLAELANPNRPLLQKLATIAPGTFQHTLFVATLAETAAKQLGCSVELVRAGALYHDIGKMHDPLGFIENQMGGPNKHETEIDNPWISADIIKKHVSEGMVLARKHYLPTAIQAFIPEHQGTMLVGYFYQQAQQLAKQDPNLQVKETDFRYSGPIPQSRETAIVMLADSCEAALRSLKDATPDQALAMVNNILRARWQDNQLIYSGLTRSDMSKIAEIFVQVWQQFHHKRIAYPKIKVCQDKK